MEQGVLMVGLAVIVTAAAQDATASRNGGLESVSGRVDPCRCETVTGESRREVAGGTSPLPVRAWHLLPGGS